MNTVATWAIDDGELANHVLESEAGLLLLRVDDEASARWQIDADGPIPRKGGLSAPSLRAFTPRSVQTLMSDQHLHDDGLCIMRQDSRSWLVSLDADRLVNERISAGWFPAVASRVDDLRSLAAEEDLPFSTASAAAALEFARDINAGNRPGVFLVGNGNVRFLWTEGTEQIGLQFRPDGAVQYVMFAQRAARVVTHMGDDDAAGILRQITASGLRHLLGSR